MTIGDQIDGIFLAGDHYFVVKPHVGQWIVEQRDSGYKITSRIYHTKDEAVMDAKIQANGRVIHVYRKDGTYHRTING